MSAHDTRITHVTGGVDGLAASYAAMLALADRWQAAAARLRDQAVDDARALADRDLLESAPLAPTTFAEAEAAVIGAATGVHGALVVAGSVEGEALLVRAAVSSYQECDHLVAVGLEALDTQLGEAAGYAVRLGAPSLLLAAAVSAPVLSHLPPDARRRLDGELEAVLDEHPEAVQHVVDGSGGLLDGILGVESPRSTPADAASQLSRLYPPESAPTVVPRPDLATRLRGVPPPDLEGLVRHLAETNTLSRPERTQDQGTVEVQRLRTPGRSDRYIVYLPGTDDPTSMPWSHDPDVRDLPADLRVLAGDHAAYTAGIETAMSRAGIGPHDPVLLVGHSLGGMEAASMLAHGSGFHVTHVVTAGSPIGLVPGYPEGTHVLSLENRGDVVPLLDGRDNADVVQHVTVQFDDPGRSVLASHALRHYVHGAAATDASADPSVHEQLSSLRRGGFLGSGGTATSQVFQIARR